MGKRVSRKRIDFLYHYFCIIDILENISSSDFELLKLDVDSLSSSAKEKLNTLVNSQKLESTYSNIDNRDNSISSFQIDLVMNRLRNMIMNSNQINNASEISWLIRILLASPEIFPQVREVDNFLSNMTGLHHDTKSTGRDRIIDWYFKMIDDMPKSEKDDLYFKIAKYLFINLPSNYKEWKEILYKGSEK